MENKRIGKNELVIFNNPEFGDIRTFEIDGEPWFVGNDIARALGYSDPFGAVKRHVDSDDLLKRQVLDSNRKMQQTNIINESGMYALIIMSELPNAKKFKRWITKEVIPLIVKTGTYSLQQMTNAELILHMAQINVENERRLNEHEAAIAAIEERGDELDRKLDILFTSSNISWKEKMELAIQDLYKTDNRSALIKRKGKLYKELEILEKCDLRNRRTRLEKRMKERGTLAKDIQALTTLDVISCDERLKTAFEQIIEYNKSHNDPINSEYELISEFDKNLKKALDFKE